MIIIKKMSIRLKKAIFKILIFSIFIFAFLLKVNAITDEDIYKIKTGQLKLTYGLMGAVGDGVTNDYEAIKATHDLANRLLIEDNIMVTVYGESEKTYYISTAEKTIKVITNVDWQNCDFVFDDLIDENNDGKNDVNIRNPIFHIVSNFTAASELQNQDDVIFNVSITNVENLKIPASTKKSIQIIDALKNSDLYKNNVEVKKDFDNSRYWGVKLIDSTKRCIRSGSNANEGDNQRDTIVIDSLTGEILTDLDWDYNDIIEIQVYPIRNKQIIIKNGNFLTKTNNLLYTDTGKSQKYVQRNIMVNYTGNVKLENIKHNLDESAHLNNSQYQDVPKGNRYSGFISLVDTSFVFLNNIFLTPHTFGRSYNFTTNTFYGNGQGTYDFAAGDASYIYMDNVTYYCDSNDSECYQNNMLADNKWGIMGTNLIKNIFIKNSKLNRIDSHMGVTNILIEDSIIGYHGFDLIGGGTAYIKNTTVDTAQFLVTLRADYGSNWNGNLVIDNVNFIPRDTTFVSVIRSNNKHNWYYGYDAYFPNLYIRKLNVKNNDKTQIGELSLIRLADDLAEGPYKYYFKDNIYAHNISVEKGDILLFTNKITKNNFYGYLLSSYAGSNIVNIDVDSSITIAEIFSTIENPKFNTNSTINFNFDSELQYLKNLYNKKSIFDISTNDNSDYIEVPENSYNVNVPDTSIFTYISIIIGIILLLVGSSLVIYIKKKNNNQE